MAEAPKGAGQYFTPRELIRAIVDCIQPGPDDTLCDPAAGTGGFLLAGHDYVARHYGSELDKDQKKHLRQDFVHGWELVPATARLCIMNLYLHGIDADPCPIRSGVDALQGESSKRFTMVLTNPPFGKKSSYRVVGEDGQVTTERENSLLIRSSAFDSWVKNADGSTKPVGSAEAELVARCAAYKAAVCLRDPYERGERAVLNLGHTFAHALEAGSGYEVPHGEAVALGLLAALRLSDQPTDVVEEVLAPEPVAADLEAAWAALRQDKKGQGVFVLLEAPGQPIVTRLRDSQARRALEALIRK